MKLIESKQLKGPRTFFTVIDKNNTDIVTDWNKYTNETDNILKVLLLTKETLVVAASNLCDPKTYEYFTNDESKAELFKTGIIKPAIRDQFNSFSEVFDDKQQKLNKELPEEIRNFFSSQITEGVKWNLEDNSGWYKDYISKQISNSKSLIRKSLRELDPKAEDFFVREVQLEINKVNVGAKSYFNRDDVISKLNSGLGDRPKHSSTQFLDLIYHISGSRVVNCENYVPQENLISYNHLTNGFNKTFNEKKIFTKYFINTILDLIYENAFSEEILENLSIKEVLELRNRNIYKTKAFREKYEKCLSLITKSTHESDRDLLYEDLIELHDTGIQIKEEFEKEVINEIQPFKAYNRKIKGIKKQNRFVQNVVDFGGIFIAKLSAINFLFNNCKAKNIGFIKNELTKNNMLNENMMRYYIKESFGTDPIFTAFIDDIIKLHKDKYLNIKI